jgi:hypothetical protein
MQSNIRNRELEIDNILGELWQDTLMPVANCAAGKSKNFS